MIKGAKICGISDLKTLEYILNHPHPPKFVGFICNYKKSKRNVPFEILNELLKINKQITMDMYSSFRAVILITPKLNNLTHSYYESYYCTFSY